jgi:zinc transport system substrate-binding protein
MKLCRTFLILFLTSAAVVVSVSAGIAAPTKPSKPLVAVSIIPQAAFVQRIAADRVEVITLVGAGQSPHAYEPTPRQMSDLSRAAIWFANGVDFERGLEPKIRSLYPSLKIVNTTQKVRFRRLEEPRHKEEGHKHEESGTDLHTWLGRDAVKVQCESIRDALAALDPDGAAEYGKNFERFSADIDRLFDKLVNELKPLRGKTVYVYHPAFGYFLDEFGIVQEAVETGGKEPTQKGLAKVAARAKKDGAKVIFVQAQFPTAAAATLAKAMGGVVQPLDALAPDWLANMERMGAALKKAVP